MNRFLVPQSLPSLEALHWKEMAYPVPIKGFVCEDWAGISSLHHVLYPYLPLS